MDDIVLIQSSGVENDDVIQDIKVAREKKKVIFLKKQNTILFRQHVK